MFSKTSYKVADNVIDTIYTNALKEDTLNLKQNQTDANGTNESIL